MVYLFYIYIYLTHIRGEVSAYEDRLDALDRQRLADDELRRGGHMPEATILFLHKEFLAGVVISDERAETGGAFTYFQEGREHMQ